MEVRRVWEGADGMSDEEVVAAIDAFAVLRPGGDPSALYERASARDYAGLEAHAEPLYRRALDAGLDEERRPRAIISWPAPCATSDEPTRPSVCSLATSKPHPVTGSMTPARHSWRWPYTTSAATDALCPSR